MKLCRIFTSIFCKCQSWNAEFLHYPFVADFLMNLAGKWLCRILHPDFVSVKVEMQISCIIHLLLTFNEFSGNMAMPNFCIQISKLKCRISAWSIFCCWFCNEFSGKMAMQNFCIIHICYNYFLWFFLQLLVLNKTTLFSHCNILGPFWLRTLSSFLTVDF